MNHPVLIGNGFHGGPVSLLCAALYSDLYLKSWLLEIPSWRMTLLIPGWSWTQHSPLSGIAPWTTCDPRLHHAPPSPWPCCHDGRTSSPPYAPSPLPLPSRLALTTELRPSDRHCSSCAPCCWRLCLVQQYKTLISQCWGLLHNR